MSTRFAADGESLVGFDFPDTPLSEPLRALIPLGPSVVNIMHTEPEVVGTALADLKIYWRGPVGVYPELGDFSAPDWVFSNLMTPDEFVEGAMEWVEAGARLLGGCCGTTPEHIRALKNALPELIDARG